MEYRICRAPDLHGLPLEIRALASTNSVTLSFSEMRLEVPGLELFQPPSGFTAYPTVEALSNELLARSQGAPRRRSGEAQGLEDSENKHGRHGGDGH